jgi:DNA-binding HxlR family transcriptional regulator
VRQADLRQRSRVLRGPQKFQELRESLSGVAPGVLSRRLKDLEAYDIVQRNVYVDHPPRAEYTGGQSADAMSSYGPPSQCRG